MQNHSKTIVLFLCFILVWDLCDLLYLNCTAEEGFEFSIMEHLIQPAIACGIFLWMDKFFKKRTR